ncbi:thioredoxin domain-containing protein [Marinilabilia sp.]|jgi:protein-disulfide isomerase
MKKHQITPILSIAVSVVLVVLIIAKLFDYFGNKNETTKQLNSPVIETPDDIVWGASNAPITVYMFSTYKCKFCALFFKEVFPELRKNYIEKGKIRFVLKLIDLRENEEMMKAIQASMCIHKFSNFEKFHELLSTNPNVIYTPDFNILLDDLIAANPDIAQCLLEHSNYNYVKKNNAEFRRHNFSGTPTFIVGEKMFSGFRTMEQFDKIFQNETSEATR